MNPENPEEQDERAMLSNQDTAQDAAGPGNAGPQTSAVAGETATREPALGRGTPGEGETASPGPVQAPGATPGAGTGEAPLRPGATDVQAYIGRQLRAVYDDVVKQPIPDRFLALMKQLEDGGREP